MNTLLVALKITAIVLGTFSAIYCGYGAVKLWQWRRTRRAVFIAFLSVLNIGMMAINASYFFQHGTADAQAPVAAFDQQPVEVLQGESDPQQGSEKIQD